MKTQLKLLNAVMLISLGRMGELELEYAKQEDVPAEFASLYTERAGKYVLTGVKNMPAPDSISRLEEGLRKERNDHKQTKEKFSKLQGLDVDELLKRNTEYDELKLRAEKVDDSKIEEIVNVRTKQRLAVIERERDDFKQKATTFETELTDLKGKDRARTIGEIVRKAATSAKVLDTAVEDVEVFARQLFELDEDGKVIARDGVGIAPGITPEMWLSDIRDRKPHWFPANFGGGGNGGNGNGGGATNPWSEAGWNITEQGKILRNDAEKAKRMASMHGVDPHNPVKPKKK